MLENFRLARVNLRRYRNDAKELDRRLQKPTPAWMIEQIRSNLSPYIAHGITRDMLDQFVATPDPERTVICLSLIGGRPFLSDYHHPSGKGSATNHIRHILNALLRLRFLTQVPDVEFLFYVGAPRPPWGDGMLPGQAARFLGGTSEPQSPVFCYGYTAEKPEHPIAFPDYASAVPDSCLKHSSYHWDAIFARVDAQSAAVPWANKWSKLFWRGATTDGDYESSDWRSFPRAKLVAISQNNPDLVDAGFVWLTARCCVENADCEHRKEVNALSRADESEQVRYKYLIALDGNCYTYPGLAWRLLSNSVVLWQETPWRGWFFRGLKPFEHYVPVKRDLSDLIDRLDWLRKNDNEARRIAEGGRHFAKAYLVRAGSDHYITMLLREYAKLQRFNGQKIRRPQFSWATHKTRCRAHFGFLRRELFAKSPSADLD